MINTALETKIVKELDLREVEAADFYRVIFPKGSLEEAGNQQPGKYNAMVYAVLPDMDTAHILHMHDDLALLNEMRVSDAYMNCISYAGREPRAEYARYLYAFFVRINLSINPEAAEVQISALKRYLDTGMLSKRNLQKKGNRFTWGYTKDETMHFIRPTYLMVDHEHLYLCFVMYRPLQMFPEYRMKHQEIVNDISERINNGLRLPAMYPVDILECRTVVGKGDCRAYRFPEKRLRHVSLDELNACVPKKKQLTIPGESQFKDQPNLFPWFLREARTPTNHATMKPRVFVVAAAYAAKGSLPLKTVMEELEKLGEELLLLFGEKEIRKQINDARYFYMYDFYWLRRRLRATLSEESGIPINKPKRNKGAEHHTRREHCQKVNHDINDKLKREADVLNWLAENPGGTQKKCSEALGISISTVNKWVKRARENAAPKKVNETVVVAEQPVPEKQPRNSSKKYCPHCGCLLSRVEFRNPVGDGTPDFWIETAWTCDNEECYYHIRRVTSSSRRHKIPEYLSGPYTPSTIRVYSKNQVEQEEDDDYDELPF